MRLFLNAIDGWMRAVVETWTVRSIQAVAMSRPPDMVITGSDPSKPYLQRWHLIPKNRVFNVMLHHFLRSDDDRALHDHPWINASILLVGQYREHTIAQGGISHYRDFHAGAIRPRLSGALAHRVELIDGPCWTLFITGPKYRDWGFHCPRRWVPWQEFTSEDGTAVGRGCDE